MTACAHCGAPFTPVVIGQTLCDRCQGLTHPEPASPLQQAEIAGYMLLHELGAGRFSHSWLGEDAQGQAVVLKLLRRYAPDPNAVQRFLAEAQRLAGAQELDHPNLARPITAGVHLVSAFFLVYQTGGEQTLADELRSRGRVLPARALELCAQLCESLAAAHALGVFHLDLKPANVGLTKAADSTEQAVVLDLVTAHLLAKAGIHAGRLPLMGATADELLKAHRDQPALRLRDVGRRMHDDLEALLACLLAKDPAHRFGSADEAAAMMRAIIPIAATAPMEDESYGFEDPVPVVEAPRPEPEIAHAPPQMLPPAFDPALVRAMMGEVPAPPEERPPGIPKWAAFVPPRWWPLAAGVGAVAAITVVTLSLARRPAPSKPAVAKAQAAAPSPGTAAPAGVVKSVVSAAVAEAMKREPAEDTTRLGQHSAPEAPAPQRKTAPAPSRWSKQFATAQKALWTGKPASAESVLRKLLRKHLSRRDQARAAKMMGDAEAKKGNKATAAGWYKKALKLSDDPDDRARVEKLLR